MTIAGDNAAMPSSCDEKGERTRSWDSDITGASDIRAGMSAAAAALSCCTTTQMVVVAMRRTGSGMVTCAASVQATTSHVQRAVVYIPRALRGGTDVQMVCSSR